MAKFYSRSYVDVSSGDCSSPGARTHRHAFAMAGTIADTQGACVTADTFASPREQIGLTRLANPLYPPLSLACEGPDSFKMQSSDAPSHIVHVPQQRSRDGHAELTVRGMVIGVIITLVFTAANISPGSKLHSLFRRQSPRQ